MAITIRTDLDTSGAKKGLQELRAETAKTAAESTAATNRQVSGLDQLEKEIQEVAAAEKNAATAASETGTARQVALLRAGQAAKEFSEGAGRFAEVYARTGDIAEAFGAAEEKAIAAMSVINPMAGVVTAAAVAGVKLWQNFNGAKEAAEEAAKATERWKAEAKALHDAFSSGIAEASKMAASFTDVFSIGDQVTALENGLANIAEQRKIIADQVSKVPEAVAMELLEQKSLLKVEELKLQAQIAVLKNRHEQIAASKTLADYDRAALKEAEKAIKKVHEESMDSLVERMDKEKERAKEAEKNTKEQAKLDERFEEDLQKLIDQTQKKIKDNFKAYQKDNEERRKLLETLGEAERKLEEAREQRHQAALQRIKVEEAEAIASMERRAAAEVEMLQGINRAKDDADKKREGAFAGPVGGLIAGANAARNDERKVFEDFVKNRVKQAEERAKADIDAAQAKAEEEARKSGADEEGVKEYGREARRKAIAANRGAGARARSQAAADWRGYQAGDGTEEERAGMQREIEGARERVGDAYLQQKKKELEREAKRSGGRMTAEEKALIDEVFRIVSEVMQRAAIAGGDMASLQEQIRVLQKQLEALEKAEGERRRRNGGRP